jgi:hypothetical protein
MKNYSMIILSITSAILVCSSCASYRASSLSILPIQTSIKNTKHSPKVFLAAKAFNQHDCEIYFDRDVLSEGYQPVQLYLQNDSDNQYLFSLDRISLALANTNEVAETVHTSTVGRAVGYAAGALVLWPLVIPAIVDSIGSHRANKSLDRDFWAKSARDCIIHAHSKMNVVIFVPIHSYQCNFTVTLIEQETNTPIPLQVEVTQ